MARHTHTLGDPLGRWLLLAKTCIYIYTVVKRIHSDRSFVQPRPINSRPNRVVNFGGDDRKNYPVQQKKKKKLQQQRLTFNKHSEQGNYRQRQRTRFTARWDDSPIGSDFFFFCFNSTANRMVYVYVHRCLGREISRLNRIHFPFRRTLNGYRANGTLDLLSRYEPLEFFENRANIFTVSRTT